MISRSSYDSLIEELHGSGATLVAVSKTKPEEDILTVYNWGQRVFGENRVMELVAKHKSLPKDIEWHMIGHLQRNKVSLIAPFVTMIHAGDSERLLKEINKQAAKNGRTQDTLLQIKIAKEESKYGWDMPELQEFLLSEAFANMKNIRLRGVMGMATFTEDTNLIHTEFDLLKRYYDDIKTSIDDTYFDTISMGMTGDYPIALEHGSNMVRIGSKIFGNR